MSSPPVKNKLIAFSGIDGAGKSTQVHLLTETLVQHGYKPVCLWTRGGYTGPFNTLKFLTRKVLGNKAVPSGRSEQRTRMFRKPWVRNVWLTLAMLDLILAYVVYIRFVKLTGRTVIADRYLWDTWIDFTLNFPGTDFASWRIWRFLQSFTPRPDHVFALMVPVEESVHRSLRKNEPFPDAEEVLEERIAHYRRISREPGWQVIDCTRPINDVAEEIRLKVLSGGLAGE